MIYRPCYTCGTPVPNGDCLAHPKASKRYRPNRASVTQKAYDRTWQHTRIAVLNACEWICEYCGSDATTVDHMNPWSRGGTNGPDNLRACCSFCNSSKGSKTLSEWIATGTAPEGAKRIEEQCNSHRRLRQSSSA